MVTYALTGEVGDDARMLEVLAPFDGHRGGSRMVTLAIAGPPRHHQAIPYRHQPDLTGGPNVDVDVDQPPAGRCRTCAGPRAR